MSETDRERFERIYRETYGRVLAYALRRTTAESAKDAVAEAFLVAWRRLDDVPSAPLPWLLGTVRRVLANQRRAGARHESLRLRVAAERFEPANAADSGDRGLLGALARLGALDREALLLVAWDGLTTAEAASAMDVSAVAFRVRLHRARRRLEYELHRAAAAGAAGVRRTIAEEAP